MRKNFTGKKSRPFQRQFRRTESFRLFHRNIGKAQGLEILPKAASLLKDRGVRFIVVGDGRDKVNFLSQLKRYGVEDQFLLIERQPPERIPPLLACADAAFVSFMKNELFEKTIPAKLQSYMACGMPILAAAVRGNKANCRRSGLRPVQPDRGTKTAGRLHRKDDEITQGPPGGMGRNAEAYCRKHFGKRETDG